MSEPRAHSLRPVLAAGDVAAVGICLSAALHFVHQRSTSTSWDAVLLANVLLVLALLVGGVLGFAFFDLYSRSPRGRRPSASPVRAASLSGLASLLAADTLTEVPDVVSGLVIAVMVALCFGRLFGTPEREATMEPASLVLGALLAVVVVPFVRVLRGWVPRRSRLTDDHLASGQDLVGRGEPFRLVRSFSVVASRVVQMGRRAGHH